MQKSRGQWESFAKAPDGENVYAWHDSSSIPAALAEDFCFLVTRGAHLPNLVLPEATSSSGLMTQVNHETTLDVG